LLVGRPLRRGEVAREQITPVEGLSALSLDALTSVAYGPEAIIVVLAAPRHYGVGPMSWSLEFNFPWSSWRASPERPRTLRQRLERPS
jgi:hypothetical protein